MTKIKIAEIVVGAIIGILLVWIIGDLSEEAMKSKLKTARVAGFAEGYVSGASEVYSNGYYLGYITCLEDINSIIHTVRHTDLIEAEIDYLEEDFKWMHDIPTNSAKLVDRLEAPATNNKKQ